MLNSYQKTCKDIINIWSFFGPEVALNSLSKYYLE